MSFAKCFSEVFAGRGKVKFSTPEDVVRYYQQLGFFVGAEPPAIVEQYREDHGALPDPGNPWDDVFLLTYAKHEAWADDPEADVCAENMVYSRVLPEWAKISQGSFPLTKIDENWETEEGPVRLQLQMGDRTLLITPKFYNDWMDLDILLQINRLIAGSGRRFECALDGNFALVLCLTSKQKKTMKRQRCFPFAW